MERKLRKSSQYILSSIYYVRMYENRIQTGRQMAILWYNGLQKQIKLRIQWQWLENRIVLKMCS